MFPYDAALAACFARAPRTVAEVIAIMTDAEALYADGDGLKWFNWLYLRVTRAVDVRIAAGEFSDARWMAELDVQFARLYFQAMAAALAGRPAVGCWTALVRRRAELGVARVQFALAGVNAHINHDLPKALVATFQATGTLPGTPLSLGGGQHRDYTALNSTFESMIDTAKRQLNVRLLGEALPPLAHVENTIAAWKVVAAREAAWQNSAVLWHLNPVPALAAAFLSNLDGLTTVAGKTLLVAAS